VTWQRDDFTSNRAWTTSRLPFFTCNLDDDSSYTHDATRLRDDATR